MKLKLKNPSAPSDAPTSAPAESPSTEPATPLAAKPGLKIKLKTATTSTDGAENQNGDAPKAKRKYNKKPKVDSDGNVVSAAKPSTKKRAREDGEDGNSPVAKRRPKPTAKSLAMTLDSDNDSLATPEPVPPPPRPAPARTQSIKLSIKSKGSGGLQRSGTAILKVKGAGKAPVRPYGVGYDSEADEAEADPAMESQFVLRMPPGSDCDLLRKAIDEKTIGKSVSQGGPGVHLRFFDREGRRAMITIQGRFYAASMVDLPTVIESLKSWNKKDWVKTADVCQMLLVLGKVQNEEEAKKYSRPSYIDAESHRFPHGLTPPMRWARKLRFRPRKSYIDVERAEAQLNRLLAEDDNAASTRYEMVDSDDDSSGGESGSDDGYDHHEDGHDTEENGIEEVDAGDLEQMLHAGFMEDDEVEITTNDEGFSAQLGNSEVPMQPGTLTTAHGVAMYALSQNGSITLEPETAASTPAAATSADDDDDDDDDDDGDSDEDMDEEDEAVAAEAQRDEQLRSEVAELRKAIAQSEEQRDRQTNSIFKKRMQNTIDKQKADLAIKLKQLNEDEDADE